MINAHGHPEPVRLRFKVDEYYKMIELGMLDNYERAEIIEGELISKITFRDRHSACVNFLNRVFIKSVSDDILVSVQNPLRISEYDEPEPDIVLSDLTKYDGKRHPRPEEVFMVVKVADKTLKYDRDIKLSLYAAAEIPEVWIVNLVNDIVEIHQKPSSGIYRLAQIAKRGEIASSSVLPQIKISVDELLG